MAVMRPPPVRPILPPSSAPTKDPVQWASLLGKPTTLDEAGLTGPNAKPSTGPLEVHATGKPPFIGQRNETSAALLTVYELKRNGTAIGFLGISATDHLCIIAADGTTILAEFDTALPLALDVAGAGVVPFLALRRAGTVVAHLGLNAANGLVLLAADGTTVMLTVTTAETKAAHFEATIDMKSPLYRDGAGIQVVGAQEGAIPDVTATSGSPGGSDSTGGLGTDPATLGDVDGVYGVTNGLLALIEDLQGTVASLTSTVNAMLGAGRSHGLIDT